MSSGFILTRGKGIGSSSTPPFGTKTGDVVIPPGETRDIDFTLFTAYAAAKWLITIVDDAETKFRSIEVHGHYLYTDAAPTHNIFSAIGDKIRVTVNLDVVMSSLILRITNDETYTVTIRSAKYDITS